MVAADLVETLSGDGPFTVFAPTNAAFDALPEGTLESLLLPENVDQLTDILTYHVLGAEVLSTDLVDGQTATTLEGDDVFRTHSFIRTSLLFVYDAEAGKTRVGMIDLARTRRILGCPYRSCSSAARVLPSWRPGRRNSQQLLQVGCPEGRRHSHSA